MEQVQLESDEESPATSSGPEIGEVIGFVLRSGKRHLLGSIVTFVSIAGLGAIVAPAVPLMYESESRIIALDSKSMVRGLSREVPSAEAFIGASDLMKRKGNLMSLVKESGLLRHWKANRAWPLRLKDMLSNLVAGPSSEADEIGVLVTMLEQRCLSISR